MKLLTHLARQLSVFNWKVFSKFWVCRRDLIKLTVSAATSKKFSEWWGEGWPPERRKVLDVWWLEKINFKIWEDQSFWHSSIACQIRQNQAKPNLKAIAQIPPQIQKSEPSTSCPTYWWMLQSSIKAGFRHLWSLTFNSQICVASMCYLGISQFFRWKRLL